MNKASLQHFKVSYHENGEAFIYIYDVNGALVEYKSAVLTNGENQINMRINTQGIYFYRFRTNNFESFTGKFVVK